MDSLVGVSEVKEYLRITTTEYDPLLMELCDNVSNFIRRYCSRDFVIGTFTELIDIEDESQNAFLVGTIPLVSVVAITDNGTALASSDYLVYPVTGFIKRKDNYWTQGDQTVEITYIAGLTVPSSIKLAAKEIIGGYFNSAGSNLESERIGRYEYTKDTKNMSIDGIPLTAQVILKYFQRVL